MSPRRPARIYCSGPLFSPEERAAMALIARTLEAAGHETFLPQRDGLESAAKRLGALPGSRARAAAPLERRVRHAIFALDVFQLLERCDALVFNMNGRVPDEGAAVEAALAFAAGKPLVLYKDDWRTAFDGQDNPMITGLSATFSTVASVSAIPQALDDAIAQAPASPYRGDAIPPAVRDAVRHGERVWRLLCAARRRAPGEKADEELLREIAGSAEVAAAPE